MAGFKPVAPTTRMPNIGRISQFLNLFLLFSKKSLPWDRHGVFIWGVYIFEAVVYTILDVAIIALPLITPPPPPTLSSSAVESIYVNSIDKLQVCSKSLSPLFTQFTMVFIQILIAHELALTMMFFSFIKSVLTNLQMCWYKLAHDKRRAYSEWKRKSRSPLVTFCLQGEKYMK